MSKATLLVIGASGDVGQGIVKAAIASGRTVIAAARNAENLEQLRQDGGARLHIMTGSLSSKAEAEKLWSAACLVADAPITEVVVSVNAPVPMAMLNETDEPAIASLFAGNVLTHYNAAQAILQGLPKDGKFIGIGGGMADAVFARMVPVAMTQAALRNLYRGLAKENRDGPIIREMMIASMVNGISKRDRAEESWITDIECGQHLCALLDDIDAFDAPVTVLKSRSQVGQPDKD